MHLASRAIAAFGTVGSLPDESGRMPELPFPDCAGLKPGVNKNLVMHRDNL